jgi:saccharopine dehydrogenase-like NADP-dependent oxidoreductase
MDSVLVIGAGKIGSLIAGLLSGSGDYRVHLADISTASHSVKKLLLSNEQLTFLLLETGDFAELAGLVQKHQYAAVISCLPYQRNIAVAKLATEFDLHYFDLTEDVAVSKAVNALSNGRKNIYLPQSGLAPGFISIVANHIMNKFSTVNTVKMRVGALPINVSNPLQYALTWSTDGLINEYGNFCDVIDAGKKVSVRPLDGVESIKIDGLTYEAFNTSGGIGSLVDANVGKLQYMDYKTIRYPGHCEKIRFLMQDLKLNDKRDVLKNILEDVLPATLQDVVLVYVSVVGEKNGRFVEENYVRKFYSADLFGQPWSAIQMTTASSLCAAFDLVVSNPGQYTGMVRQEQIAFDDFINNRFGCFYDVAKKT